MFKHFFIDVHGRLMWVDHSSIHPIHRSLDKWPTDTFLQTRLPIVRANPLYQNLYNDVKREGDCNGRK